MQSAQCGVCPRASQHRGKLFSLNGLSAEDKGLRGETMSHLLTIRPSMQESWEAGETDVE